MLPFLREHHADPGRLHAEGHVTRIAIEEARESVAALFGARPREVVFTSSGTEAINTAVWGALTRHGGGHVVTTAVEHSAVLGSVCAGFGYERHRGRCGSHRSVRRARGARRDPARHRAGLGAARQPRGRHAPARGRDRRGRARARRRRPRRRVRGRRARTGRLRGAGRRPLLGHRAQVRRPEGRRRVARAAWSALSSVRAGRCARAGAPRWHRGRTRDRRIRRGRRRAVRRRAGT